MSLRKATDINAALAQRYSDAPQGSDLQMLHSMAARGSVRAFRDQPVPHDKLETLCAVALAAPSKSDLQQRDIVLLSDPLVRAQLAALVGGQAWVAEAPMIAVFCANNRRQRLLHDWHDIAFANDHLDAFFNASVDTAIALGAFVSAAEAAGLGCCPISAVRNAPQQVASLLGLPDHVFAVAGLAIGYPARPAPISQRLPLGVTVHHNRYDETGLKQAVAQYDATRASHQPYASQRLQARFGHCADYCWSHDKTRQYSQPERAGFGDYIRAIGFTLD